MLRRATSGTGAATSNADAPPSAEASTVYEALEKFLKLARDVRVESRAVDAVAAEVDEILERVWGEHQGKALPQGLNVTEALGRSPVMVGVTKKLLGA